MEYIIQSLLTWYHAKQGKLNRGCSWKSPSDAQVNWGMERKWVIVERDVRVLLGKNWIHTDWIYCFYNVGDFLDRKSYWGDTHAFRKDAYLLWWSFSSLKELVGHLGAYWADLLGRLYMILLDQIMGSYFLHHLHNPQFF